MIDTLFFILQIVGVAILLGWAVMNDRIKNGAPSRGLLAYKHHDGDDTASDDTRHGLTRPKARANLLRRKR